MGGRETGTVRRAEGGGHCGVRCPLCNTCTPQGKQRGPSCPQCFHKLGPSGLPSQSGHRNSSRSVGAGTSCLGDLCSDVTVFTRLCPTWGCLHLGFHHVKDAALLLLSTGRAAVCPHKGGGWCHSGAGAQLGCGTLWRAQQEQPPGALTRSGTEASAGLVPLPLDLLWPHAISPSLQTSPAAVCSCQLIKENVSL